MCRVSFLGQAAFLAALASGAGAPAHGQGAQLPTGEIFGRVVDSRGTPIAGVVVALHEGQAPDSRRVRSSSSGAFAFPRVLPGRYDVSFSAPGGVSVRCKDVEVQARAHTRLDVRLPGGRSETVSDERNPAGLLLTDSKSPNIALGITRDWLEHAVLAPEEPLTPRLPALVVSPLKDECRWPLTGASRDSLDAILVERVPVEASLTERRLVTIVGRGAGVNRFTGGARYHLGSRRLRWSNLSPALREGGARAGDEVRRVVEASAGAGGPLSPRRVWAWGSASRTDADTDDGVTITSSLDARLQYQPRPADRLSVRWSRPSRFQPQRRESPYDRPEATERQHSLGLARPLQLEHQWLPSDRLALSSAYAFRDGSYVFDFQQPALAAVQSAYDRFTLVRSRSGSRSLRRAITHEAAVDAELFSTALGGDHSMKFGLEYEAEEDGREDQRGGGAEAVFDSREGSSRPWQARLFREGRQEARSSRWSAYLQDSIRMRTVTVHAGVRLDRLDDEAKATAVGANGIVPDLLPAVAFPGADSGVVFADCSPRVGIAWDVGGSGGTVIKGAFARSHPDGNDTSAVLQPTGETRLVYWWSDANGDAFVGRDELDLLRGPAATPTPNYDPSNPSSLRALASVDSRLENVRTASVVFGFEQRLSRVASLRVGYAVRRTSRIRQAFRVEADGAPVDSRSFYPVRWTPVACREGARCPEVVYFQRDAPLPPRTLLRNDGEYSWRHTLDVVLHKRFTRGWMLDAAVSWNRSRWHSPLATRDYTDPTNIAAWDGTEHSAPAPRWAFDLSGSVRLPWHLDLAGVLDARDGLPYDRVLSSPNRGALGSTNVLVGRYGEERYPAVVRLDTRVQGRLRAGRLSVTPAVALFNALNSSTILRRNRVQNSATANGVMEIVAPRSLRVELAINW